MALQISIDYLFFDNGYVVKLFKIFISLLVFGLL